MELRQYTVALLKWWWLIVASVAIATVSSFLGTLATPPTYVSRTTIMVGQALQNPNPSQSEFYTGQALAQTYADLAKREPVLRGTLATFGLTWAWTDLQKMVASQVVPGTQLLQITVLDNDPERARILADEIAQQLILQSPASTDPEKDAERQFVLTQIEDLKTNITNAQTEMRDLDTVIATANSARQIQDARSRQQALQLQISTWQATYAQLLTNLQRGTPNFLSVVEPASNGVQVGPNTIYNLLLAAAIGLVLSGGAAVLLEYLDDTVKTPEDVQRVRQLPTLGGIARMTGADQDPDHKLITMHHPRSPVAEAYRVLRTSIQFSDIDQPKRSLLITSASAGEGKTTTAANLAVVIAQAGHRVLLIDADLRRPMLHKYFDTTNSFGLTDRLLQIELSDDAERIRNVFAPAIRTTPVEGLFLLSSGSLPPNPSELLGSAKMKAALAALQMQYDYVVFDSPPVLAVTDAVVLATQMDSVLFVVNTGTTRQGALQQAIERLAKANIHITGAVLNRLSRRSDGYYYYYHYDYNSPGDNHSNGGTPATPATPITTNGTTDKPNGVFPVLHTVVEKIRLAYLGRFAKPAKLKVLETAPPLAPVSTSDLSTRLQATTNALITEVEAWHAAHPAATQSEIEAMMLRVRQKVADQMANAVVDFQPSKHPVEKPRCTTCHRRMRFKDEQPTALQTEVGVVRHEHGYYYCPHCHSGLFAAGASSPKTAGGV